MLLSSSFIDRRYKGLENWESKMSSFSGYIKEHIDIFCFFIGK